MRSTLGLLLLVLSFGCGSDPKASVDAAVVADAAPDAAGPARTNGCLLTDAVDRTAAGADRTITFDDSDTYSPKCMKIAAGQSVTWTGSFSDHPLKGGVVASGASPQAQTGSPVPSVSTGGTTTAAFPAAGSWAYYCTAHQPGMSGVVYVQ